MSLRSVLFLFVVALFSCVVLSWFVVMVRVKVMIGVMMLLFSLFFMFSV